MTGRPLRVVLVMIEPPDPFGSAASRWFYVLVRELVARGHRLTAFAACTKAAEMARCRELFPAAEYDLRLYDVPAPDGGLRAKLGSARQPMSYLFSAALRRDLDAVLADGYDVLHLEHTWSGWLGLGHTHRAVLNVMSLYAIDLAGVAAGGPVGWVRRRLLLRAERRLAAAYPRLHTLSDRLRDGLAEISPAAEVEVVPLGLDHTLYPYTPDADRPAGQPVVTLVGSMRWRPTYTAAVRLLTRLWPGIRERVPDARLQVVGWDARAALEGHLDDPGVTIIEDVPDTRPYFERATVLVYAPDQGSGMKVKVLEALAYGVPVVTTPDGVEGLPATDGVEAGVAADDAGLIDRAVRLLTDPAAADRQRAAGRALVERQCGPGPTVDRVERTYRRVVGETVLPGGA